jgi:quercetin dioxygenase-like cupin family protein
VMGLGVRQLRAGHVVVLPAKEKHSVRARTKSALLLTLLLRGGDAGNQGGGGQRRDTDEDAPASA